MFVTIEKKFYDVVNSESGVMLYKDTTFHPEEAAMIIGKVVSVPKTIQKRLDYEGVTCPVRPGDTILMRYDVVSSYKDQPDRSTPTYKNVLLYKGVEYWRVNILQVFAILTGSKWKMINGYVLCNPMKKINDFGSTLIVPDSYRESLCNDTMKVRYIGETLTTEQPLPIYAGKEIHVKPKVAQHYELPNGDSFYIIKQSHILGVA